MGPSGGSVGVGSSDDGGGLGGWSSASSATGSWSGGADAETGFLASRVGLAVEDEFVGCRLEQTEDLVPAGAIHHVQ